MKRAVKLLASLLVTFVFMWFAFRDTDWATQIASLKAANYAWVVPYFGCLMAIHVFRTLRWGALLSGLERVPFRKLNEASGIGFMMLLVLPFRLGEFARPFLIAQRSGIRRSAAMTSVVLERIVDGLFVAAMMRVLLFFVPTETPEFRYVTRGSKVMFAVFGGGLVFLLFALWQHDRAVRWCGRRWAVSPRLAEKMAEIVDGFVGAMRQLPRAARQLSSFYTVAYWGLNGVGMALLARAFGAELTLFQGFVVLWVLVVGLMIPAAPGMMGTFQAGLRVGLSSSYQPGGEHQRAGLRQRDVAVPNGAAKCCSVSDSWRCLGRPSRT